MLPEDEPTAAELYLYFIHFFMSEFKATVLLLETENKTSCYLYEIMKKFRNSRQRKISDELFGMKVKFALRK